MDISSCFRLLVVLHFDSYHQMLDSFETDQARVCKYEYIAAPSSICFTAMPPPITTALLPITITPAPELHDVGDCYGCSPSPSQRFNNMFTCEVTHQGLASGPGSVYVFGIRP